MPLIFVAVFALQSQRVSCVRELCHKEWGRGASPGFAQLVFEQATPTSRHMRKQKG